MHPRHTVPSSRRQWLQQGVRMGATVATFGALSACGFQLRKAPDLPFKTLYTNIAETSLFGQLLKRNLQSLGNLEIITDVREIERADVVLDMIQELQEKVILSRTSTGTVREFTLRLRVRFKLRSRNGDELIPDSEIVQEREISFSETAALSKESEEQLLYRDMRSDLVQQLIRRLAAARLP
ncbi:MAG: LPS assembly lipoprotein LptE [Burkholderiaceae bacterium]|jgi:LPS-assembly lipoprotein|nr:LPS assembly lipoprotein LptE [Burkholderiaceae bacterium]